MHAPSIGLGLYIFCQWAVVGPRDQRRHFKIKLHV